MKNLNYLFKGKLIDLQQSSDHIYFKVLIPRNVNDSIIEEKTLFEEVIIKIEYQNLFVGFLQEDKSKIKASAKDVFSQCKNRCFYSDMKYPFFVDDVDIPIMINVNIIKLTDSKMHQLEFILPIDRSMPYVIFSFSEIEIFDSNNFVIDYSTLINELSLYYEYNYLNPLDRESIELIELHNVNGSVRYYKNKLRNDYWLEQQSISNTNIHIDSKIGELCKPLWIIIEKDSVKYDEYGSLIDIVIKNATKSKEALNKIDEALSEVIWMPSDNQFTNLNVITTYLIVTLTIPMSMYSIYILENGFQLIL